MIRVQTVGGGNVGQSCRGVARVIFCVQPFSLFTAEEDNVPPSILPETSSQNWFTLGMWSTAVEAKIKLQC